MKYIGLMGAALVAGLSGSAMGYSSNFTLDMETPGAEGWLERNAGNVTVTGVTTATDTIPYSPGPTDPGTGYNGSKMLTIHTTRADNQGITTVIHDGSAGGSMVERENYTVKVELFVPVNHSQRFLRG